MTETALGPTRGNILVVRGLNLVMQRCWFSDRLLAIFLQLYRVLIVIAMG